MEKRAGILVSGRVQGVFFRDHTRRWASDLGLTGWVKNLSDGRVEVLAEGRERDIYSRVQVASMDTLYARGVRSDYMVMPDADVLIIDEAHLMITPTRIKLLNHYAKSKMIGL